MKIAVVSFVLGIIAIGADGYGQTYSLSGDWNGVSNPNGVWSYGDRGTGTFVSYGTGDGTYGNFRIFTNEQSTPLYDIGPGQVILDADYGTPDARFTAPATAVYDISIQIGGSTAYQGGGYGNADADLAGLYIGATSVPGSYNPATNIMSWNIDQSLVAGTTVDAYVAQRLYGGETQTVFQVTARGPTWTGFAGDHNWATAGNWSPAAVPIPGELDTVGAGGGRDDRHTGQQRRRFDYFDGRGLGHHRRRHRQRHGRKFDRFRRWNRRH